MSLSGWKLRWWSNGGKLCVGEAPDRPSKPKSTQPLEAEASRKARLRMPCWLHRQSVRKEISGRDQHLHYQSGPPLPDLHASSSKGRNDACFPFIILMFTCSEYLVTGLTSTVMPAHSEVLGYSSFGSLGLFVWNTASVQKNLLLFSTDTRSWEKSGTLDPQAVDG